MPRVCCRVLATKAEEMQEVATAAAATVAESIEDVQPADQPESAAAADAAALMEQEMREPVSEEMSEVQKKKATAGL